MISTEILLDKVLGKPNQYLVSTDNALAFVGYPKEIWIVPKNLATLVVRGSVQRMRQAIKLLKK
ncbi:hypothetical protein AL714_16350 [Clostridium botulinum]|nr:hypothetical protein NZ45_01030 [Clostridium botulinum]OPD35924.1 hypothetical protein AL714_16350 [Clostridium botulinum]